MSADAATVTGAGLIDRHVQFVGALRTAGLPVSMAESLDATQAMAVVDLREREQLRAGYAAALARRGAHRATFARLFALWWPSAIGEGEPSYDESSADDDLEDVEPADLDALREALRD